MTAAMVINNNSMSVANTSSVMNENLIAQWLKFADVSEKSIKTYTKAIRRFVAYINSKGIVAPTADDVYEWRDSMKAENKSVFQISQPARHLQSRHLTCQVLQTHNRTQKRRFDR